MKKKPGGISKKTDARVAILLNALEKYMPFTKACDYAEIDRTTGWRWLQADPDLATRVRYSMSKAELDVLAELVKKDPKFWIKNMDSENFRDMVEVNETKRHVISIETEDGTDQFAGYRDKTQIAS